MNAIPLITSQNLRKTFIRGAERINAVDGVSLNITGGDYYAFVGPSGSGKTTLIHLLGCLDNPTEGYLEVRENPVFANGNSMQEKELTKLRRDLFGYVFQKFYLIPTLTVRENILLPFTFYRKDTAEQDAMRLARLLGLEHRLNHLPKELSGGEMQRVAIARALINKPAVLLADEPTGNLDTKRSGEIGEIFQQLNIDEGITIILVTHNLALAGSAGKIIALKDGRIE